MRNFDLNDADGLYADVKRMLHKRVSQRMSEKARCTGVDVPHGTTPQAQQTSGGEMREESKQGRDAPPPSAHAPSYPLPASPRRSRTAPTPSPCLLSPSLFGSQRRGAPQISSSDAPSCVRRALRLDVHGTIWSPRPRNPDSVAAPRAGLRAVRVRVECVRAPCPQPSPARHHKDDEDEGKTMATALGRTGTPCARETAHELRRPSWLAHPRGACSTLAIPPPFPI